MTPETNPRRAIGSPTPHHPLPPRRRRPRFETSTCRAIGSPTPTPPPVTAQTPPSSTAVVAVDEVAPVLSILVVIAGAILIAAGGVTWFVVRDQLADEKIVVSDDAERFSGDDVDGPLTAYSEAEVIEKHALEASGGLTYAELDQDDPVRETVITASSYGLRCSRRSSPSESPRSPPGWGC